MTLTDLTGIAPLLVLAGASVVVLLAIAFCRDPRVGAGLVALGLLAALLLLPVTGSAEPARVGNLLVFDDFARYFVGLLAAAALAVVCISYGFLGGRGGEAQEYYLLLLLATIGAAVLAASVHFAGFFLALEILSVSLYALIAYPLTRQHHIEAAAKYLILAGVSSAFLLFGMALVYATTGRLDFAALTAPSEWLGPRVAAAGWGLILTGIGFKLAVVPFHLWTPDIYEGAPAPVAAYVATVSKGAVFALLVRLFVPAELHREMPWLLIFSAIAIASMLAGNLLALLQENVKRILAYSSIAHLGYLLVAFLAGGDLAVVAVAFYLAAYFVTTLAAFGIVTVLSNDEREAERIADYAGLFWHRPWLGATLTAALLSLAGIPLTVGFVGKVYLLMAGVSATLWLLVFSLIVASAIGLFYYLRIIVAVFAHPEPEPAAAPAEPARISWSARAAIIGVTVLLFWLGVYPEPVIAMIQSMLKF